MKAFFKRNYLVFILVFISVLIIYMWFRSGLFLAGGEEALSIWNSKKFAEAFRYTWFETGTGIPSPTLISRTVLYSFTAFLSKFLPVYFVQSLVFLSLMLTGVFSVFLLSNYIIKNNRKVAMIASLFYLLNLYSQTQVWARFLYAGMFAWAYLPLFLFLWIKWLREGKLRFALLFAVTNVLFSNTFSQPAYLFTFWIPAGVFVIVDIWAKKKDRLNFALLVLARSFVGVFLFTIVNIWWIFPYLKVSSSSFGLVSDSKTNLDSLRGVSQYFPTSQILLLRQSFLFGKGSLFYNFYSQPWVIGVSILVLLIVVFGILSNRKEKYWLYLVSLLFVGWFVSKGSNPPSGYGFFQWLFSNFPFTAALRNPYEKFGIVWLLPYSIFFALGLAKIRDKLGGARETLVSLAILVLGSGVLVWPMWTGEIYAKNVRLKIPEYYKEMNDFLNDDLEDVRVLSLPAIPGDGLRYFWGYQGLEPSDFLYDKPVVSKMLRAEYFDSKYSALVKSFSERGVWERYLEDMDIKYLILNKDLDTTISGGIDQEEVFDILRRSKNVSYIKSFGNLELYSYSLKNPGRLSLEGTNLPDMTYKKINPVKYEIGIMDSHGPFNLVFKETYNDLWEATIEGEKIKEHFVVYDYANAWKINREGSYTINISFKLWPWD